MKTDYSYVLQTALLVLSLLLPASVSAAFTAAQKTELVVIHNRLREGVYPRAAKMTFVTWNTRLASLAQTAAEKCDGEHNYGGDYASLGENIYNGFRTNVTEVVLAWHIEKAAFNFGTSTCSTTGTPKLTTCGHYLQLITDGVLEIGCGHHICSGNNMVYCEYSSGSSTKPFTASETACSRCPSYRGLCLNGGLCVNSSMVAMADVQAYNPGVSAAGTECKLNCSNCGVSSSVLGVLDCYCKCVGGVATGEFCDNRVANSQLPCSVCNLTSPCLNGGTDLKDTTCRCQCPDSFVGTRCQIYRPHYLNGMRLGIAAEKFCAFDQCLRVPVTRTLFKTSTWSRLRTAIAQAVNSFCTASAANFALCCPSTGGQTPSPDKRLISDSDVGYLDNEDMYTDDAGLLGVVVYANASSSANTLCPGARRKRAVDQAMVSQSVLQSAIQQLNSSISGGLGTCCGLSVQSVTTYQSYANAKYSITITAPNGCSRSGSDSLLVSSAVVLIIAIDLIARGGTARCCTG